MRSWRIGAGVLATVVVANAAWAASPEEGAVKVNEVVGLEARPFAVGEVTITGGPFLAAQERGRKYLLAFDIDRLIAPFYETAGEKPRKPRYGGWEAGFVPGHMLGHWLSASTRMAKVTGDTELKRRIDYAVAELAGIQARHGDGYVSGLPEKAFEEAFAGHVTGNNGFGGQSVPWYTMHKIYAGLIDAYEISGNAQALEVVRKLADWAKAGTDRLSDAQFQQMLQIEHGGMMESMAELYAITGEKTYLDLARRFTHHAIFDPLAAGRDDLAGKHANTQIPKMVGAARVFELTGDDYYRRTASYFWDEVVGKRSYVFGGDSIDEHFRPLGQEPLGPTTAETCNTYNMLRLTKEMMALKEESRYGDYYERALFNQILGSQNPDDGTTMYFISTKPGHFKVYGTPFDSMWCCTGTGLENPARYTEGVYSHNNNTLWVNLFMATELNWKEKGMVLRQETNFPEAPGTKLVVEQAPAGEMTINVRVPYWAAGPVVARVNGKETARGEAGSGWLAIHRTWARGDTVDVSLPMNVHVYHAADPASGIAFMYGPIVLAGEMGRANFPKDDHFTNQTAPNNYPAPPAPVLVSEKPDPASLIKPVEGKPLTFITAGAGRPEQLQLIPFWQIAHERYTVYFNVLTPEKWAQREKDMREREAALAELDKRTVDQVRPGEQQPEADHQIKSQGSNQGSFSDRNWRDAANGGWFSYQVKVMPDAANILRVTYWGSDVGARDFEILVDGRKIAEQKLNNNKPDEFFDVDYAIPEDLTKGKDRVEVKFQGKPDNTAGGIFGLRILKKE